MRITGCSLLCRTPRLQPVRCPSGCRIVLGIARSGRDGQIRTADLSLRRRPLYPSELRPHIVILNYFGFQRSLRTCFRAQNCIRTVPNPSTSSSLYQNPAQFVRLAVQFLRGAFRAVRTCRKRRIACRRDRRRVEKEGDALVARNRLSEVARIAHPPVDLLNAVDRSCGVAKGTIEHVYDAARVAEISLC